MVGCKCVKFSSSSFGMGILFLEKKTYKEKSTNRGLNLGLVGRKSDIKYQPAERSSNHIGVKHC